MQVFRHGVDVDQSESWLQRKMFADGRIMRVRIGNGSFSLRNEDKITINVTVGGSYVVEKRIGSSQFIATPKVGSISTNIPQTDYHLQFCGHAVALVFAISRLEAAAMLEEELGIDAGRVEFPSLLDCIDHDMFKLIIHLAKDKEGFDLGSRWIVDRLYRSHSDRSHATADSKISGLSARRLRRVDDLIAADPSGTFTLQRLSTEIAMSPFHFAREFKKATGLSPHRYVMRQRTDMAIDMLCRSRQSVSDIAYATGFVDAAHLARHVGLRVGCSPKQLQKLANA